MKKNNTLLIIIAYSLMIIIWSTTPLAIKWSSEGVDFITGLSARILIGAILSMTLALLWYKKMPFDKLSLQVYFASGLSIFSAMLLVYWGAQFISSGLISVLFGLSPIFTAAFAWYLLEQKNLHLSQLLGAMIGLTGLVVIFHDQIHLGADAFWGILATLCSVILHCISAVWIKRLNRPLPALIVTAGGLGVSLPLFLITFMLFADPLPTILPVKTLWSILYLGVIGSVIGFVSYYFVLSQLTPATVALATLITPITALIIGQYFNQEHITNPIFWGSALIISGLFIHQYYDMAIGKLIKTPWLKFASETEKVK